MRTRKEGFYRVKVTECNQPFWTIGLWVKYSEYHGGWLFAQGDGDEMGAGFTVVEVDEKIIMKDRIYI